MRIIDNEEWHRLYNNHDLRKRRWLKPEHGSCLLIGETGNYLQVESLHQPEVYAIIFKDKDETTLLIFTQ